MIDAETLANTFLNWGLYGGVAIATITFISATVLRAIGDNRYKRLFLGSLVALILSSGGWSLVTTLLDGNVDNSIIPYEWVFYALAGLSFVVSVIYFALGRVEEGLWQMGATFLVAFAVLFIPALTGITGVEITAGGEQFIVYVTTIPSVIKPNEEVKFTISFDNSNPPFTVYIDYGDGYFEEKVISDTSTEFIHRYTSEGGYAVKVTVQDSKDSFGVGYAGVSVSTQETLSWPWNAITNAISSAVAPLMGGLLGIPLQMLYLSPYLPVDEGNVYYSWYQSLTAISIGALAIYIVFRVIYGIVREEDVGMEIINTLKDALIVIVIIVIAPYIYNITASIVNSASGVAVSRIDLGWMYAGIISLVSIGVALSYFSPAVGNIASFAFIGAIGTLVMGMIRYWLIMSMIIATPIIAISFLHPAFRRVVGFYLTVLSGLVLAGPITALALALISDSMKTAGIAGLIAYYISSPITVALIPWTIGVGASGNLVGGTLGLGMIFGGLSRGLGRTAHSGFVAPVGSGLGQTTGQTTFVKGNGFTTQNVLSNQVMAQSKAQLSGQPSGSGDLIQKIRVADVPTKVNVGDREVEMGYAPMRVNFGGRTVEMKHSVIEKPPTEPIVHEVPNYEGVKGAIQKNLKMAKTHLDLKTAPYRAFSKEMYNRAVVQLGGNIKEMWGGFKQGLVHGMPSHIWGTYMGKGGGMLR
jgi:carbon starvation protein